MGRRKKNGVDERKFVPTISSASRIIAARRIQQQGADAIPNFMREIKCQARAPLDPIPINTLSEKFKSSVKISESSKNENVGNDESLIKPNKEVLKPIAMSKQAEVVLDDNIFTFKPKVSMASAKIVENLGTDFMARQQLHLERQKRLVRS